MNLEHHRKDAKRLLRAVCEGSGEARGRARAVLGEEPNDRFQLSDALHVIAREQGYRSWPELKRAAQRARAPETLDPERIETAIETGLEYQPGRSVQVRVVRRGRRTEVSDGGAAFNAAGRPRAWREAASRVERDLEVNFSRSGAISLPVVPVGPPEEEVVRRIGEASRAFYQELLDLP